MKKNSTLILLVCILNVFRLNAQHTVSGIVSDKNDNAVLIEGVSVYIPEFNRYDVSKEGGTYILTNVGIGVVAIQFSKEGYRSIVKIIDTKDSAVVVNVEMVPSCSGVNDNSITTMNSLLPEATSFSTKVFSSNSLAKADPMNVFSALSYQPGFDIVPASTNVVKPIIRGIDASQIVMYAQGSQQLQSNWSDPYLLNISSDGFQNIEFIKGPAALMYGANSLGGAIIFQDERPAITGTRSGDLNLGVHTSNLGANAELGIKGSALSGVFYSLRGGIVNHTSYIQGVGENAIKNTELSEYAPNSKYKSTNIKATVGVSKKWGLTKITYSNLSQTSGIVEQTFFAVDESDPFQREREFATPFVEQKSQVISSETNYHLGKSALHLNLSYQTIDKKETDAFTKLISKTSYASKLNALTYDLKFTSDLTKKYGYTIGVQGYSSKDENYGEEGLMPDVKLSDLAAYLNLRYDLKKVNFMGAVRYDSYSTELVNFENATTLDSLSTRPFVSYKKDEGLLNASVGLVFYATDELSVKANFGMGNSAPSPQQLGVWGKNEALYAFEKGNQNLKVQNSSLGELGIRYDQRAISVELTAYNNNLMDYIYLSNTGVDTVITADTLTMDTVRAYQFAQGNAKINGGELSLTVHSPDLKWLTLNVAFSMIDAKLNSGGYLPGVPGNKLVAGIKFSGAKLNYMYKPYFSVVASNYFEQKNVGDFEAVQPSYTLIDIHLGGSFKWGKQFFEIAISGNNLFDTGYYSHLSPLNRLGSKGIRSMGRNVNVMLKIPFGLGQNKAS